MNYYTYKDIHVDCRVFIFVSAVFTPGCILNVPSTQFEIMQMFTFSVSNKAVYYFRNSE